MVLPQTYYTLIPRHAMPQVFNAAANVLDYLPILLLNVGSQLLQWFYMFRFIGMPEERNDGRVFGSTRLV